MQTVTALLPEGKLFDLVFSEAIAPAAAGSDFHSERISCEFSSESKLGNICAALEKADLVMADISGRNPNVMYLVGYSHGIGKKVLLLAAQLEDFPFDRHRHPVIGYAGDRNFLKTELTQFLSAGTGSISTASEVGPNASDARQKFQELFGEILTAHNYAHEGGVEMENPTTFVLLNQDMDLALVQALARKARELGVRLKLM